MERGEAFIEKKVDGRRSTRRMAGVIGEEGR
jgi:hypothetical protein